MARLLPYESAMDRPVTRETSGIPLERHFDAALAEIFCEGRSVAVDCGVGKYRASQGELPLFDWGSPCPVSWKSHLIVTDGGFNISLAGNIGECSEEEFVAVECGVGKLAESQRVATRETLCSRMGSWRNGQPLVPL